MDIVWRTEPRKISDLNGFANNPRRISKKQVDDLRASIERFNFVEIPAINADGTILAGHQRLSVMCAIGRGDEVIDVRVPSRALTDDEAAEYVVRSNKNTGEWDFDVLSKEFSMENLLEWGFDEDDFPEVELIESQEDGSDDAPSAPESPITVHGDVYQLGNHRLICGSSTDADLVATLFGDNKANLILTDPPYGVNYEGPRGDRAGQIKNDDLDFDGIRALISEFLSIAPVINGAAFYIFAPSGSLETAFRLGISDGGFDLKRGLVWVKNNLVLGHSDYHIRHETVLYGWKDGGSHYFTDDRTKTSVLEFDKPQSSPDHPTMKPVDLLCELISNSSKRGWVVYEPFAGSGSTLIACEKLGRKCMAVELDPKYCDVIVRRFTKFCLENGREPIIMRNGEECHDFDMAMARDGDGKERAKKNQKERGQSKRKDPEV